jgi:hypothetical protein
VMCGDCLHKISSHRGSYEESQALAINYLLDRSI